MVRMPLSVRLLVPLVALGLVGAACTQPAKPPSGTAPTPTASPTAPVTTGAIPPSTMFSTTPRSGIWGAADGEALASAVIGDVLYIGGTFTTITSPDGSERRAAPSLAAISLATGRPLDTFQAYTNGEVRALETDGQKLFVGGKYTTINGTARPWLNALNPVTGAVDTSWSAGVTAAVRGLAIGNGSLYVGGWFGSAGGARVGHAARLSLANGAVDPRFAPFTDTAVFSVAVSPDGQDVYLGGDFSTVGGQPRRWIAGVDAVTGAPGPALVGATGYANAIAVTPDGSRVIGALKGHHVANRTMAWNTTTGAKLWDLVIGGDGAAAHIEYGRVFVGFHDNFELNRNIKMIAIFTATGAVDRAFMPSIDSFKGVKAITSSPAYGLIATGAFSVTQGISTPRVAVFPRR
jgi:hypothetical protein